MAAPRLRVIDGGSPAMRREEARIEGVALMHEVESFAIEAQTVLTEWHTNLNKLARRASEARLQVLELEGNSNDAA